MVKADLAISTRGLSKTFLGRRGDAVVAVDRLDVDVAVGEIVAFLGPNGAGKTTTMNMLTTLLSPSAGAASICGYDLRRERRQVRRCIGYVAQGSGVGPRARPREELILQGRLHGMSSSAAATAANGLMNRFDIRGVSDVPADTLSGGQRRRLDLALGMVHQPSLLFLDEPTVGLDPTSRDDLWQLIATLQRDSGTTIFLTTHYLDEADRLADRILLMDRGSLVASGTPSNLKRAVAGECLTLSVTQGDVDRALGIVSRVPGAREVRIEDGLIRCRVPDSGLAIPQLVRKCDEARVRITSLQVANTSLSDVFRANVGGAGSKIEPETVEGQHSA